MDNADDYHRISQCRFLLGKTSHPKAPMTNQHILSAGSRWLFNIAALFFIIGSMQSASPILNPLFLAIFIAIICWQPLLWLKQHKIFQGCSKGQLITIVIAAVLIFMLTLVIFIGSSINDFIDNMPVYQEQFIGRQQNFLSWTASHGFNFNSDSFLTQLLDPTKALQFSANVLGEFGSVLADMALILLTVIFLLLEAFIIPVKFEKAFGNNDLLENSNQVLQTIRRYLWLKTQTSFVTGFIITLWLLYLNVDYAVLWGFTAFLLNFIPSVGSVISAIPPLCLILLQSGFNSALIALAGYIVIHAVIDNLWEPKLMGRGLGLALLALFLSLVFWGWVFGPVGMLLSVPFTIIIKIVLGNYPSTRWIAIFLSSEEDVKMDQEQGSSAKSARTLAPPATVR